MRARALPVLLAVACGGGGDDDAPPPTGPISIAVEQYDVRFDLTTRDARAVVRGHVFTEGDCLTLPFRGELIGAVTLDGAEATVTSTDAALTACGVGWRAGDSIELAVEARVRNQTWGSSQVGYSIKPDANQRAFYYLVSWIGGCDRFAPCDHAPDRFAHYRFEVVHPAGVRVLCPGTVEPGATETVCTFDLDGGPTYSTFGIVASDGWEVSELGAWNGIDVTIYNRAGSGVAAAIDGAWQGGYLAWLETHFGPYPYGNALRVVTGPTFWAGFEHPGNIVLADGLDASPGSYTDPVNHVLAHELTHQWAGDQTTLRGTYDFVWKEAMAEYLTFVYEAETRPEVGEATARLWKTFAMGASFHPVPEEQPPLLDYYGHVYGPGPLILFRQLEALFSREQVIAAIAALLGEPRAIGIADVQAALEQATGADLEGYFQRWVHGSGAPSWPRFAITTADAGSGMLDVTVTQAAPEQGLYGCAFAVQLRGAAAEDSVEAWFDLGVDGATTETVTIAAPAFAVTSTVLDPHGHCLAYPPAAAATPLRRRGWSPWIAP